MDAPSVVSAQALMPAGGRPWFSSLIGSVLVWLGFLVPGSLLSVLLSTCPQYVFV